MDHIRKHVKGFYVSFDSLTKDEPLPAGDIEVVGWESDKQEPGVSLTSGPITIQGKNFSVLNIRTAAKLL